MLEALWTKMAKCSQHFLRQNRAKPYYWSCEIRVPSHPLISNNIWDEKLIVGCDVSSETLFPCDSWLRTRKECNCGFTSCNLTRSLIFPKGCSESPHGRYPLSLIKLACQKQSKILILPGKVEIEECLDKQRSMWEAVGGTRIDAAPPPSQLSPACLNGPAKLNFLNMMHATVMMKY